MAHARWRFAEGVGPEKAFGVNLARTSNLVSLHKEFRKGIAAVWVWDQALKVER